MSVSFLTDLYLECGYEDLKCLRYKMNTPKEKQIWISSCVSEKHVLDITLWKNIKCVMLILFFLHDTH